MAFLFSNPIFLAALAGLGVPVLIHLLLKRRNQRMRFSTLRFFQRHEEQANQRRKLRNLMLLALRLLIFALLVFAFSRPFLPNSGAAARPGKRQQAVLVLDRSLSMASGNGPTARWNLARNAVRESLTRFESEDRIALVSCADTATVLSGFAPPSVIAAMVDDLQPSTAPTEISEGIREADRLLKQRHPGSEASILVVSDLQRTSSANLNQLLLPRDVALRILNVGDLITPNIAVTGLRLEPDGDLPPHATVTSFSDEVATGLQTELLIDGNSVWTQTLRLDVGAATNLDLSLPRLRPGWHSVQFRLKNRTPDAQPLDDSRYLAILVPEPVRVLCVEGRGGRRSYDRETFFISTALDPSGGETNAAPPLFEVETVGSSEAAARLRAAVSVRTRPSSGAVAAATARAATYDVVIVPNPKWESADWVMALQGFVQAGGGVLLLVGDGLVPLQFNRVYGSLLPANLRTLERAEDELPWRIGEVDTASSYFNLFAREGSGNLGLIEFVGRYRLDVLESGRVVGRYDDDVPLAVARELGAGRLLMMNTSADTSWNDWPKHKTFVPWLHRAVLHLGRRDADELYRSGAEVVAGKRLDLLPLTDGVSLQGLRVGVPGGGDWIQKATGEMPGLEFEATRPGIYRVADGSGSEIRRFAANVAPAESDLTAWKPREFDERMARGTVGLDASLADNLLGIERNQREFWRVLLLGALVLLVVETLWANRTYA